MSDESQPGLSNEPAGDKLDSIISTAIEKSEAPGESGDGFVDGASEPKIDKAGRAHGADGKFIPKDSAAKASEPEQAPAATTADPKPDTQPAQQSVDAPHTWSADDKAKFATWPRDVQEAVLARYKAMEADYTRKNQEVSELRKSAEPYLEALKPYEQYLAQIAPQVGRTPSQLVREILAAEYGLRTGQPQEKYQAFARLAQNYGVDLAAFARGEIPQQNPALEQLRQELSELRNWKSNFETQVQQQQNDQAQLHIETFANAKDEHGHLKYPLFEQVKPTIAHYLANDPATPTLEAAYAKATAPLQEAVAAQLTLKSQQAEEQRKASLAKAERAAPVRSSGSQPGGSAKSKGLDSILDAAISKAGIG